MTTARKHGLRAVSLTLLGIAVAMLALGQTLLRETLDGIPFILYWLACMGCTALALGLGLLDLAVLRHRMRRQEREILKATLGFAQPPAPPPHRSDSGRTTTR